MTETQKTLTKIALDHPKSTDFHIKDKLEGRKGLILAARHRKLAEAREARAHRQQSVHFERFLGSLPDIPDTVAASAA